MKLLPLACFQPQQERGANITTDLSLDLTGSPSSVSMDLCNVLNLSVEIYTLRNLSENGRIYCIGEK